MKNIIVHKNYAQISENYQLKLPIDLEVLIPEDDSVRLLSLMTEELDYTKLYEAYSPKGRNPVVEPKILFKILLYAYMNDISSSRQIELACKRDINFMWLLQGYKVPDHNTISRFRSERLNPVLDDLFYQFIVKLYEIDEIELLNNILIFLTDLKVSSNIEFVYGKGKRKTEIQKLIEMTNDYLEKQTKYDMYNSIFDGRNSFSKTDTDATFMHMKDDHMRNAQLKPGYNVQIAVEGEYVVGLDISSERSDQLTLIPFLEKLGESLPAKYKNIVADAGYESEENYVYLEENEQVAYIKPQNYETMKTNKFKNNIGKRENMTYDEENDIYLCHNNRKLKFIGTATRKSKSGYLANIKVYECENCNDCHIKAKCTKSKGNKKIQVSPVFVEKRLQSLANINSDFGILARMNRSIQVEGTFGVIKGNHGFRIFLTRGKKNVKVEFTLLCLGYNINKLHNKIQQSRLGVSFYTKATA